MLPVFRIRQVAEPPKVAAVLVALVYEADVKCEAIANCVVNAVSKKIMSDATLKTFLLVFINRAPNACGGSLR